MSGSGDEDAASQRVGERLAAAAETVRSEQGTAVEVRDRTICLVDPVKGDLGNAILRVLALVEAESPVGAAARGPNGVAAGVWRDPELYLTRWTKGKRWVVGYRLTGGSDPRHYVRTEGRIPTRLETGNWYGSVPDEVAEAFFDAGILLDDPPFPVPRPVAPPPPPPPPASRPRKASASAKPAAAAGAGRTRRPPKVAPAPKRRAQEPRVCPSCRMHKVPAQFVPGSDLCVDCR